jgi:DNA-binding transcriptional LysR family regulator
MFCRDRPVEYCALTSLPFITAAFWPAPPAAVEARPGGEGSLVDAASLASCARAEKEAACERILRLARTILPRDRFVRICRLPGYRQGVELRQLEAFVAVATELHFGRAAKQLHIGAPTLSELIRRLERELGTPLFTRTTRRVAITSAGAELLTRSKVILDEVAAAKAAARRVADGEAGTVRLGITPPVAPVLAPHLISLFAARAPEVTVELRRMWLPKLLDGITTGDIDVALTCGPVAQPTGIATEVFCAEPLVIGLRPDHRLASRDTIALAELAHEVLGIAPEPLFPAWALTQRQALDTAGIAPPTIELADTDLAAIRWADQRDVDWLLLIPSLAAAHTETVIRPVAPRQLVPFTLQWNPSRAHTLAVARFVHCALAADLPPGWHTQPDHLRHTEPYEDPQQLSRPVGTGVLAGSARLSYSAAWVMTEKPASPWSAGGSAAWPRPRSCAARGSTRRSTSRLPGSATSARG